LLRINKHALEITHKTLTDFPALSDADYTSTGYYCCNIKSSHQDVFCEVNAIVSSGLLSAILDGKKAVRFDMLNMVAEPDSPLDWKKVVTPLRPFFDFERYVEISSPDASLNRIDEITLGWQKSVFACLRGMVPAVEESWIYAAQCHRVVSC
jgi:hypothetical protein